jgi:hypothetical protein
MNTIKRCAFVLRRRPLPPPQRSIPAYKRRPPLPDPLHTLGHHSFALFSRFHELPLATSLPILPRPPRPTLWCVPCSINHQGRFSTSRSPSPDHSSDRRLDEAPPTTATPCHRRPNPTIQTPKVDHGELRRSPLDLPVPSRQYPGDQSGRRPGSGEALRRPWRWPTVSRPESGPPLCGLNPPYSLYKNNFVIPWKIQQFYMDTPQHHQFSISVQILNKHQLQPTILHLHPCLLHRSPPNIVYFLICHRIFPN